MFDEEFFYSPMTTSKQNWMTRCRKADLATLVQIKSKYCNKSVNSSSLFIDGLIHDAEKKTRYAIEQETQIDGMY